MLKSVCETGGGGGGGLSAEFWGVRRREGVGGEKTSRGTKAVSQIWYA